MAKKKKRKKIIQFPQTLETQIRTRARNLKIGKCYISKHWEKSREGNILITREHTNGNFTIGLFLVDLGVFGVKDVAYEFNMSKPEFLVLFDKIQSDDEPMEIDYEFAHNIIYGSVEYANDYGFNPHKDFATGKYILKEDNEKVPYIEVEFGQGGLPTIFCSEDDQLTKEISHLDKVAGVGNYQVIYFDLFENEESYGNFDTGESLNEKEFEKDEFFDEENDEIQSVANLELWKKLYSFCDEFFSLKPWEYLYEIDFFAIEIPDNKKNYFISIMGSEGNLYAISAYEEITALQQFWDFHEHVDDLPPESILTIPHILISLDTYSIINNDQKAIIKQLKLKSPEKQSFPHILRTVPGFLPDTPGEEYLDDLYHILKQSIHVVKRARKNKNFIHTENDDINKYLFRVPVKKDDHWTWKDQYRLIEPVQSVFETKYMPGKLKKFVSLPADIKVIQFDLFMMPGPIKGKGTTDYFAFIILLVDRDTGVVVGFDTLSPFPDYQSMLSMVSTTIMDKFIELGIRPLKFEYKNHNLSVLLSFFTDRTPVEVVQLSELPALDEAIEGLLESLMKNTKGKSEK